MTKRIPKTLRERLEARERCQKANAIFSDDEIRTIRRACDKGDASYVEIAQEYGCGMQTVRKIHRMETYTWVREEDEARVTTPVYSSDPGRDANTDDLAAASLERLLASGVRPIVENMPKEPTPQEIAAKAEQEADAQDAKALGMLQITGRL